MDVLVGASTFGLACWLGVRVFRMEREAAMLIGAGSAICGAAAVMAAEPVVRGRAAQVTVAVSTVVVFVTRLAGHGRTPVRPVHRCDGA
ncbi:hypothetical protein G6F24_017746 [Rhizopus arrhizus]|nr:hypothetical protein G6F24_017746 [Rhizopus arrhizus]